ncbi:hypothetical protein [Duganella levis]|uniref:DUF4231 domain-containing protein n=1 Tax=Duganella levis TaxID=2692169 RepID=A0ABW9W4I7_9BURK|nr:hypothetical protein [Duganella levis]MYN28922.1 hypothetical protein [Duganella levis]
MQKQGSKAKNAINRIAAMGTRNPHITLSGCLFSAGGILLITNVVPTVAGALFGAAASLLGAGITEFNKKKADASDKVRREADARRYLAAELNRAVERMLFIHQRACANFICASTQSDMPNDKQEDFIPHMPTLYPDSPQFRDLSGDDAIALIVFYDALQALERSVEDWWQREGQLPVNIFNAFLGLATDGLLHAKEALVRFELDRLYPPRYQAWKPLSERVESALMGSTRAMEAHLKRHETPKAA